VKKNEHGIKSCNNNNYCIPSSFIGMVYFFPLKVGATDMKYLRCLECKYHFRYKKHQVVAMQQQRTRLQCPVCGSWKVSRSNKTEWCISKELRTDIPKAKGKND